MPRPGWLPPAPSPPSPARGRPFEQHLVIALTFFIVSFPCVGLWLLCTVPLLKRWLANDLARRRFNQVMAACWRYCQWCPSFPRILIPPETPGLPSTPRPDGWPSQREMQCNKWSVANPVSGLIHVFRLEAGTPRPRGKCRPAAKVQPWSSARTGAGSMRGAPRFSGAELPHRAADGRLQGPDLGATARQRLHRWGSRLFALPPPYAFNPRHRLPPGSGRPDATPSPASRPPDGGPLRSPGSRGKTGGRILVACLKRTGCAALPLVDGAGSPPSVGGHSHRPGAGRHLALHPDSSDLLCLQRTRRHPQSRYHGRRTDR